MISKESQIADLWKKCYKQSVQEGYITNNESITMIANQLNIDIQIVKDSLKESILEKSLDRSLSLLKYIDTNDHHEPSINRLH
ncbi:MAG: hypothetical protein U9Q33_05565 [Campylobacterota bacterium]|nr:hypothetical protein [Campylobacterota bacterium]